tara:strand:+ start:228 stop:437 length:210 start_codon:yes stop_codon:yes gene_type:complete
MKWGQLNVEAEKGYDDRVGFNDVRQVMAGVFSAVCVPHNQTYFAAHLDGISSNILAPEDRRRGTSENEQ